MSKVPFGDLIGDTFNGEKLEVKYIGASCRDANLYLYFDLYIGDKIKNILFQAHKEDIQKILDADEPFLTKGE